MSLNWDKYHTSGLSFQSKGNKSALNEAIKKATRPAMFQNPNARPIPKGYHEMPDGKVMADALHKMKCGGKVHKMQNGGMIFDPNGQWAHPGENTRIPSDRITMKGVNYPVVGVGSTGETQMMMPDGEYSFPNSEYVDEYPLMQKGGTVSLGPAYDSRYGFMGKLAYDKSFRGQRDRSTMHNLSGDLYGGDFGLGISAGHRFGSENRNFPAFTFADSTVGYDKTRGTYFDFKGGADIHLLDDRYKGKVDITPYGGVFAQSKASEQSMDQNDLASNIGLQYGLNARYQKDLGGGKFEAFAGIAGSPSLGKMLSEEKSSSGKVEFAPQFNIGANYTLPLKKDKMKAAVAKQKAKEAELRAAEQREAESLERRSQFTQPTINKTEFVKGLYKFGGEVMELTDAEINNLKSQGYEVEVMQDGGDVITKGGYDYMKEGDKYFTRETGSQDWIEASDKALASIKYKIYGEGEDPETPAEKEAAIINRMRSIFHTGDDEAFWSTEYDKLSPKEQQIHNYSSQLKAGDITHDPKSKEGKAFETYVKKIASPEAWMKIMPETMGQVFDPNNDPNKFKYIKKSWGNATPAEIETAQDRGNSFDGLTDEKVQFANEQKQYTDKIYAEAEARGIERDEASKLIQNQQREEAKWASGVDPNTGRVLSPWEITGQTADQYYKDLHNSGIKEILDYSGVTTLAELSGIPSLARVIDDPKKTWEGIKQTGSDIWAQSEVRGRDLLGMDPNKEIMFSGGKNPYTGKEYWSGVDETFDALTVAGPLIGMLGKGSRLAKPFMNKISSGVWGKADDIVTPTWNTMKSKEKLKFVKGLQEEGVISKTIDVETLMKNPNLLETTVKKGIKDSNTSYRSVFPEGGRNTQSMSPLDEAGFQNSGLTKQGEEGVAEAMYMSTTIPNKSYGMRAGMPTNIGIQDDVLFTSNRLVDSKPGIIYGSHTTKLRPKIDFTEGDILSWYDKYVKDKPFNTGREGFKSGDILGKRDNSTWPYYGQRGEQVLEPVSTTYSPLAEAAEKNRRKFNELYTIDKDAAMSYSKEVVKTPEFKAYLENALKKNNPFGASPADRDAIHQTKGYLSQLAKDEFKNIKKVSFSPLKGLEDGGEIMELTDSEIQKLIAGGAIVVEY